MSRRLIALGGLVCVAAIAIAVFATSQGGSTQPSLNGASFTTRYPNGWTLTTNHPYPGVSNYALSSTSSKLNTLNIPIPGAIGITVDEFSVATLATLADPAAASQDPVALLPHVIGIPRTAVNATIVTPLHPASLGGVPAAAMVYSYTYNNVENIQSDVVARHGATIVSIETDAEPSLSSAANSAMASAIAEWHWR